MFFILDKNVKAKSLNILRKTKSERMVDIVKLFEVSINIDCILVLKIV